MSTPLRPADWRRLMPGVYSDAAGAMHIDVPELLRAYGYADTEANREMVARAAEAMARQMLPGASVIVVED